ncbi:MAG: DUF167 domain-containing protein, partial [Thermodesulfobacteriota bacterium]|nr:DUF167 domain-containing protein [Thermodesulfobacteriota bacterium]
TGGAVHGKANRALKDLIAKRLSLPKKNVEIISGERSRAKTVMIDGPTLEEVTRLLEGEPLS